MTTRRPHHCDHFYDNGAGVDNYVGKDFFLTIKIFHWLISLPPTKDG